MRKTEGNIAGWTRLTRSSGRQPFERDEHRYPILIAPVLLAEFDHQLAFLRESSHNEISRQHKVDRDHRVPAQYLVRDENTVVMCSLRQGLRCRMNVRFPVSSDYLQLRVSPRRYWIPCENLCEKILPKSARIGESCLKSAKRNFRPSWNLREMRRL